ncbi:hypothetical protein RT99_23165 [Flavobacterium sp. MEB061]|uniref:hypothetical protein n=1 Tax=Flavobacterium sp. MEB061 TaxID=1587524 RepID=UPI0005AC65A6|nr:hypothetical protein [Flavobacterium sp. MEB061]KIQ14732.1 hypothetical protein RT99_23165 [Flavobacterium sp. MEB061]
MPSQRLRDAAQRKQVLAHINTQIIIIKEYLRALPWQELPLTKVCGSTQIKYTFNYPPNIKEMYTELERLAENEEADKGIHQIYNYAVYGDTEMQFSGLNPSITLQGQFNRIDVLGGFAMNFRNLGLGSKIYKYITSDEGYITSAESDIFTQTKNSLSSSMIWFSLYNDDEVLVHTDENRIIAVMSEDLEKYQPVINEFLNLQ